jgi:hypothetical protein
MVTPLWEWAVPRETGGGCVGVSKTRRGAMEALTKALIATGGPSRGCVVPMLLADQVYSSFDYIRLPVEYTAIYDGATIHWSDLDD